MFDTWHFPEGQYSWSTNIGVPTFCMMISSKCMSVALPGVPAGQDLILSPLSVPVMVQFLIQIPCTGASFGYLPRLPILMPCPGPHVTVSIWTFLLPSPNEMQSSPVFMFVFVMLSPFNLPMWIPSVLRLVPGALMVTWSSLLLSQPNIFMWKNLLLVDVKSFTTAFLQLVNLIFWELKEHRNMVYHYSKSINCTLFSFLHI